VKIKRYLAILLLFAVTFACLFAQRDKNEKPPVRERLFFGGNLGLQFGTITDIEISPLAGIWLLPRLAVAAGPSYRFYKDPVDRTSIYGGSTYLQFMFLEDFNNVIPIGIHAGLFAQAEYEVLSLESSFFKSPDATGRFVSGTALLGGGISQYISQRSALNIAFLWAVSDNSYSIYGNPEIRISVIF